ncbi:MAG: hydroxymethylbilane synthase [Chloroflexi bacterium]|nr:MAG: hydroxymethylbilane synthase [Chloroflexota bacterium]
MRRLRLGTRSSRLALVQSGLVAGRLRQDGIEVELVTIVTEGDLRQRDSPIKDGVFVKDLEHALVAGEIDLAVHSAKDLPLDPDPQLPIAAYPERADPLDALVTRSGECSVTELSRAARVGTDSPRRSAFLRAIRPDLRVVPLMGNVDARVKRLDGGEADALVLAAAGLERLGLRDRIAATIDAWSMPPAPAQGALAIQVRRDDAEVLRAVRAIDNAAVRTAVIAERAVLKAIGGGCDAPVGVLATVSAGGRITIVAGAASPGGGQKHVVALSLRDAGGAEALARGASAVAAELLRHVSLRPRAILDTRPELDPAGALLLGASGYRVVHVPTVVTATIERNVELERARRELGAYQWVVLTSKRGVAALFDGLEEAVPRSVRFAAVGPSTARALRDRGVEVDVQPELAVGDEIPRAMAAGGLERGDRVLLARADAAAPSLPVQLWLHGAHVDDVVAYRTVRAPRESMQSLLSALADPALEGIVFASGSAVRGLVELAGPQVERARSLRVFTIGPSTSAVARSNGFKVTGEAGTPDAAGLSAAVQGALQKEVTRWLESQLPTPV